MFSEGGELRGSSNLLRATKFGKRWCGNDFRRYRQRGRLRSLPYARFFFVISGYADIILKKFITSLEGKVKAQKKSGLDEALEDVKAGRIHKYENFEAFKQKMLEL